MPRVLQQESVRSGAGDLPSYTSLGHHPTRAFISMNNTRDANVPDFVCILTPYPSPRVRIFRVHLFFVCTGYDYNVKFRGVCWFLKILM